MHFSLTSAISHRNSYVKGQKQESRKWQGDGNRCVVFLVLVGVFECTTDAAPTLLAPGNKTLVFSYLVFQGCSGSACSPRMHSNVRGMMSHACTGTAMPWTQMGTKVRTKIHRYLHSISVCSSSPIHRSH